MTYHPVVGVATVLTAASILMIGYRVGRTHAAFRDLRAARRDIPGKRKMFWGLARPLILGGLFLLTTFIVAAYNAAH
ncbi:hypothetical protein [Actinoplanes sp. NPDC051494]|uniref:hypothetical protein n=1 Tax=Actinoplanes sp. NPDC051494 TaxID=3363907 RepID=UPI0037A543CA